MAGSLIVTGLLLTLVYAAIYLVLLWLIDPYEREPLSDLGVMLLAGAIAAPLITWLFEAVFHIPNSLYPPLFQVYQALGAAASPNVWGAVAEEAAKGLVVLAAFVSLRREFDDTLDGFVYGAVVGVGFAVAQSVVYIRDLATMGQAAQVSGGFFLAIFVSGLSQCFFTSLFGASLGYMRESAPGDWAVPVGGFVIAAAYHMAYVGLAAVASAPDAGTAGALAGLARSVVNWLGILLIIFMLRWAWGRERQIFSQMLPDEVATGAVTRDELSYLTAGHRVGQQFAAWRRAGWAHYQALRRLHEAQAHLAFAKWRLRRGVGSEEEVKRQREVIQRLREARR